MYWLLIRIALRLVIVWGAGSSGSPMLFAAASGGESTVTVAVRAPGR
jgi:hypothetical protein